MNARFRDRRRRFLTTVLLAAVPATAFASAASAATGVGSQTGAVGIPVTVGQPTSAASQPTSAAVQPKTATIQPTPAAVQRRLVALRYLPASAVGGRWDYRTAQALTAFQAWEGLVRDGSAGPRTLSALAAAKPPRPRQPAAGREVEVFRALGVTLLVDNGQVVRAVHSSSGKAGFATPVGGYRVYSKSVSSWSVPYRVWLPYASYFTGGIAFHAYASVPAYPASHGCIRIPVPDAPEVYAFARLSTRVVVY